MILCEQAIDPWFRFGISEEAANRIGQPPDRIAAATCRSRTLLEISQSKDALMPALHQARGASGAWRSRVVRPDALGPRERDTWTALCANHETLASPFYSFAFVAAVGRVHRDVQVCVIEREGRVLGFLPFQFDQPWQRTLRAAQRIGGDLADQFGLIAAPELQIDPGTLLDLAGLGALTFNHLHQTQLSYGLTGEAPETGVRMPVAADPAGYWAQVKTKDSQLLSKIRRRERNLVQAHGPIRFEFAVSTPEPALEELIVRKRQRYRDTGVDDPLAPAWKRALLAELAQSADPQCQGVLSTLHAGDTWVASHFGLRHGGLLHFWFPVYNNDLAKFGPGHLLLKQVIDASAALGLAAIDRGSGDQGHKTEYVVEEQVFYRGYWRRPGLRSLVHRVAQSIGWRWQKHARTRRAAS